MAPKGKKGVSGKLKKHSKKQLEKILRKQEKDAASRKRRAPLFCLIFKIFLLIVLIYSQLVGFHLNGV